MEYTKIDVSWEEALKNGDIESALKRIQYQIALNLMNVHNSFCDKKLEKPVDVFAYMRYGDVENVEILEKISPFKDLLYDFLEIGNALNDENFGLTDSLKRDVVSKFQALEEKVQSAMLQL